MMLCPSCKTSLTHIHYETQDVSSCSNCGGLFLEQGQLQSVIHELISQVKINPPTVAESYKRQAIGTDHISSPIRQCPQCQIDLRQVNYSYDSNVFIDICESCRGLWADKGEVLDLAKYVLGHPQLKKYGEVLISEHTKRFHVKSHKTQKILAIVVACVYLILGILNGPGLFIQILIFITLPLACIFYGDTLGSYTGVRFRLTFITPMVNRESPGWAVRFMGWILFLLPIPVSVYFYLLK